MSTSKNEFKSKGSSGDSKTKTNLVTGSVAEFLQIQNNTSKLFTKDMKHGGEWLIQNDNLEKNLLRTLNNFRNPSPLVQFKGSFGFSHSTWMRCKRAEFRWKNSFAYNGREKSSRMRCLLASSRG